MLIMEQIYFVKRKFSNFRNILKKLFKNSLKTL